MADDDGDEWSLRAPLTQEKNTKNCQENAKKMRVECCWPLDKKNSHKCNVGCSMDTTPISLQV